MVAHISAVSIGAGCLAPNVEDTLRQRTEWLGGATQAPLHAVAHRAGAVSATARARFPPATEVAGFQQELSMTENFDTAADDTDVVDLAWAEMEEFFTALGARGPAATPEQWEQDRIRFVEIQERCNSLVFGDLRMGRQSSATSGQGLPALDCRRRVSKLESSGVFSRRENAMSDDEVPRDDEWLRRLACNLLPRLPADRDKALRVISHLCALVQSRASVSTKPRPTLTIVDGGPR
jgi:hypothetical protein